MTRASRFAVILALLASSAGGASALAAADSTSPTSQRIVGTIRTVDANTRVIELITGVGYATRVIQFRVAEDARLVVPRAASDLSSLIPGTYARVEYITARAVDHFVALSIEVFSVGDGEDTR